MLDELLQTQGHSTDGFWEKQNSPEFFFTGCVVNERSDETYYSTELFCTSESIQGVGAYLLEHHAAYAICWFPAGTAPCQLFHWVACHPLNELINSMVCSVIIPAWHCQKRGFQHFGSHPSVGSFHKSSFRTYLPNAECVDKHFKLKVQLWHHQHCSPACVFTRNQKTPPHTTLITSRHC